MTIGIYGGSFNPIHIGHTALAQHLCINGYIDELWFMVSPQNPLKTDSNLLDENIRLHLAKLATIHYPQLKISDFEFHLPRPSYTVDTLHSLRTSYPNDEFVLIIGADNWLVFDRWKEPQDILLHHRIIIYPRPGYEINESELPKGVTLVDCPLFPISSTAIRQMIKAGQDYTEFVDQSVANEIIKNKYYL